jgi:hypothetical protein
LSLDTLRFLIHDLLLFETRSPTKPCHKSSFFNTCCVAAMRFQENDMNQTQFSIDFVLAALATWRVTHLLANEDGPWDLIFKLRAALGDSLAGGLMDCFKCLSLWVAVPAAFFVTRTPVQWMIVWLALSGAACLLQRLGPAQGQSQGQVVQAEQESPPEPKNSEGDFNHVLWSEAVSAQERSILGEVNDAGAAADESGARQIYNGTCGNGTYWNGTYRA